MRGFRLSEKRSLKGLNLGIPTDTEKRRFNSANDNSSDYFYILFSFLAELVGMRIRTY